MKIEKIKKTQSGKYKIELENEQKIITYDDVILKHNLLFNQEIDSDKLNELSIDTTYYDIYNKCLKFIGRRLRSEKEMINYLDKFNLVYNDKMKIIADLKKINFINDLNFTKAYISDRIYLNNDGPDKIRKDLLEHNIDLDIIENELNKIDLEVIKEKLMKLISKKIKNNHKDSKFIMQKKIYNDMLNLGYSSEMINTCYNSFDQNDNDNLKREFDKLYYKLIKKEDDNHLFLKIRQKLYQKGYSLADIDKLIDERNLN